MVLLRLVVEPPITARPSGCSFSLFELGCAPAFRIQFCRDHPPCQSVCHSVSLIFSRFERIFSQLLGDATEQMSLSLGQTLAGLLNATFGNAVEIIVGLVALFKGEVRIVQTSVCPRIHLVLHVFTVYRCSVLFYPIFSWFWVALFSLVC